jgi:hypothetical protein
LLNFINETADADDADVVFQYLAMGEVVYGWVIWLRAERLSAEAG